MVLKLLSILAILAYHFSVFCKAEEDKKDLVPVVSNLISGMTKQLRVLCAGAPPTTCSCAGNGNTEVLSDIAPEVASEISALKLWDCKPNICACADGKKVDVKRPKIAQVPKREEILQLIKKAVQMKKM